MKRAYKKKFHKKTHSDDSLSMASQTDAMSLILWALKNLTPCFLLSYKSPFYLHGLEKLFYICTLAVTHQSLLGKYLLKFLHMIIISISEYFRKIFIVLLFTLFFYLKTSCNCIRTLRKQILFWEFYIALYLSVSKCKIRHKSSIVSTTFDEASSALQDSPSIVSAHSLSIFII